MNVVVSGSRGLVGSALVPALEQEGHTVRRLVRGPASGHHISWDPTAGDLDPAGLEGTDAIVHLAGEGIGERRWSKAQKDRILHSRVQGTTLVAETLARLEHRPRVLVSASAVGYYGDRGDEVLTEDSGPGHDFLAEVCRRWEASTAPAEEAGIRVAHIRSGVVVSAEGGFLKRQLPLFRAGIGGRLGSGRQHLSWISIHDQVGAIRHLLADDSAEGPFNLTSPRPVTNAEFTRALGRVLHRPTVVPVPAAALEVVLGRRLARSLPLASQRALPARLEAGGYVFRHPEVEEALGALLT